MKGVGRADQVFRQPGYKMPSAAVTARRTAAHGRNDAVREREVRAKELLHGHGFADVIQHTRNAGHGPVDNFDESKAGTRVSGG